MCKKQQICSPRIRPDGHERFGVQVLPEVAEEVVREEITKLLAGSSLQQYNQQWTAEHAGSSLRHRASAAEMMALLDSSQSQAAAGLLLESSKDLLEGEATALWTTYRSHHI